MFCSLPLGEETQSIITIVLLLIPATFYIMGLMDGRLGRGLFLAGIIFHVVSMVQRGLTIGMVPLTEKHDTISFLAFAMALIYWYFSRQKDMQRLGDLALPLIVTTLLVAFFYEPINTLSPFFLSPWFFLHILFYFTSYAFFGISACIGLLYLLSGRKEHESLQYRGAVHGWILFSLSLVVGSVWFFIAYGTYWLWTSRELWATLMWSYYGAYLHARYVKDLSGRPAAIMGLLGFLVALFAYFGVGTILPSPPTQF